MQAQGGGVRHQGTGDFVQSFWLMGVPWRVALLFLADYFLVETCQVSKETSCSCSLLSDAIEVALACVKKQFGAVWVLRCWLDPSELAVCSPVSTTSPLSRCSGRVSQQGAECAPRNCCSAAAGRARLGLLPAGAAPLRHGFLCPLSSTHHCAVVFGATFPWCLVPPGQGVGFLEDQELQ